MLIFIVLFFPFVLPIDLKDLNEFGTPGSNLEMKCLAFPGATAMHRDTCYIRDPASFHSLAEVKTGKVACKHIRGFQASIPKYNEKLATWLQFEKVLNDHEQTHFADRSHLKGGGTNGSVICRYKDFFSCANGYVHHNTHCFKVFANQVTWSEARNFCKKQGGSLAVPHNDRALQFLSTLAYDKKVTLKNGENSFFWIGLSIPDHKTLTTADGTPADHFRWLPLGHKRPLTIAFKTPNTAVALASSAANTGHVGVFGYNQVINGNFHKLPFVCQTVAKNHGRPIYVPHSTI